MFYPNVHFLKDEDRLLDIVLIRDVMDPLVSVFEIVHEVCMFFHALIYYICL